MSVPVSIRRRTLLIEQPRMLAASGIEMKNGIVGASRNGLVMAYLY